MAIEAIVSAALKAEKVADLAKNAIEKIGNRQFTPKIVEKAREGEAKLGTKENPFKIPRCINRKLDGNGLFVKKTFKIHGVWVEGVFPKFEGVKITLDKHYMSHEFWEKVGKKGYVEQMKAASRKLYEQIEKDPKLAKKLNLTKEQIQALKEGKSKIPGKTWHHFEELGPNGEPIMQLIDDAKHAKYKHTGGSYTWNAKHLVKKYGEEKLRDAKVFNSEANSVVSNFPEVYKAFDFKTGDIASHLEQKREVRTKEVVDKALSPEEQSHFRNDTIEGRTERFHNLSQQLLEACDLKNRPFTFDLKAMPENHRGSYNYASGKITLNKDVVTQLENYASGVRTLLHEIRHTFQHEACNNPVKYGISNEKALEWSNNFRNYIPSEYNYKLYRGQPVEVDAITWAGKFIPQNGNFA